MLGKPHVVKIRSRVLPTIIYAQVQLCSWLTLYDPEFDQAY
jgi:hypothetical protein